MEKQIRDDRNFRVTIKAPLDKKGQPTTFSDIVWQSSNEAVASVEPAEDGMSALVVSNAPGAATVSVAADGDPGEGVTSFGGAIDVTVTPGVAVAIELEAGPDEDQVG